ncbi:MAG: NAD-dependent epimerase/dehydratase family protein [Roseburia sp.]|uniref:NAD-dependent epimerase/dehydratase family protein n=1 Tax=Roseburia hominis TaxID=301301 RepID=UPI001F3CBE5F|nr:NAD-dependent epimerase/dehydratase family protein [Roseburia hominis]MEE1248149.1 NAD-dependent epimerase/dehydratase family protein [Lachnospiraceae bacterium]
MRKILVTGGTVFVSKYVAEYYVNQGDEVYVLNRGHKKQPQGVKLIEADRHELGSVLRDKVFDVVLDVTAYTKTDVTDLLDALGDFKDYIFISSSAVYPETAKQPFVEEEKTALNKFWGDYGTNKIEAEQELLKRVPQAYVLRPPYLYGEGNNVYREAFVFECALKNRKFYLPKDGKMKLQFFHVDDLCRMIDALLAKKPAQHIFNVGNEEMISIKDWVTLCYEIAGKTPEFVSVTKEPEQRNYFSFYDYEYQLDIAKQKQILKETMPLKEGLKRAFAWYKNHENEVIRKDYISFIDENLAH